jgi:hypothetical protein
MAICEIPLEPLNLQLHFGPRGRPVKSRQDVIYAPFIALHSSGIYHLPVLFQRDLGVWTGKFSLDTGKLRCYRFAVWYDQESSEGRMPLESVPVEDRKLQNTDRNALHESSSSDIHKRGKRAVFLTRSLAEVYAQQGHVSMALEIYRGLQQSNPSNQEISDRITELEANLGSRRGAKSIPERSGQEDTTE